MNALSVGRNKQKKDHTERVEVFFKEFQSATKLFLRKDSYQHANLNK